MRPPRFGGGRRWFRARSTLLVAVIALAMAAVALLPLTVLLYPAREDDDDQDAPQQPERDENDYCDVLQTRIQRYPLCRSIAHLPTDADLCEFDVTRDTRYLPDPRLLRCLQGRQGKAIITTAWHRDLISLSQRVDKIQNVNDCSRRKWHVVKWTSHGHGVNTFVMAWNVGNHWDRNFPVLASVSPYRFGDHGWGGEGRGWSEFLSPLSSTCTLNPHHPKLQENDGGGNHPLTRKKEGWKKSLAPPSSVINHNLLTKREAKPMTGWCLGHGRLNASFGRCDCDLGYLPTDEWSKFRSGCRAFPSSFTFTTKREKAKWYARYFNYHGVPGEDFEDEKIDPSAPLAEISTSEGPGTPTWRMTAVDHWLARSAPGEVFPGQNVGDEAHTQLGASEHAAKLDTMLPSQSLKAKYGFFWWVLAHVWLLHADSPARERLERRARESLALEDGERCVGIHVRRGDSCDDPTARHRKCHPLTTYFDAARELAERYHQSPSTPNKVVIYLATDDPSAVEEAEILERFEPDRYRWVWHRGARRSRYVNGRAVDNNPDLFNPETMEELYTDLWTLATCDLGLVAGFSSSVAWIAYALAVGRAGYYLPFISVDYPWGHELLGGYHAKGNALDGTLSMNAVFYLRNATAAAFAMDSVEMRNGGMT